MGLGGRALGQRQVGAGCGRARRNVRQARRTGRSGALDGEGGADPTRVRELRVAAGAPLPGRQVSGEQGGRRWGSVCPASG